MGNRSGLTSFLGDSRTGCRAGCRAGCRRLEHTYPLSRLRSDTPDASADKQALDSEAASCTGAEVSSTAARLAACAVSRSLFPCVEQQPTQISRRFTGSLLKDSPAEQRPARSNPDYSVARLLCGWPWLFIVWTILLFTEHCHMVLLSFACMMQLFQCIIR